MEMPWITIKKQTDSFVDGLKEQLGGIFLVVIVVWAVYALDKLIYFVEFDEWFALKPRQFTGLHGILTMPFVHANLGHIVYNTITLIVGLLVLAALRPKTWFSVLVSVGIVAGVFTWVLGASGARIVGASGVVMGVIAFLVAPGAFLIGWWAYNRITKQPQPFPMKVQPIPLIVSAIVGFFYMDNLFFNLVPIPGFTTGNNTSWSAHWCGAIAGLVVAFVFLKRDAGHAPRREAENVLEETYT